jgi:tryptophan synthase alpha chain
MNRILRLFQTKKDILSIYFTAGYPALEDSVSIIETLTTSGVDLIEIGMPYSDPLADGPVIQASSTKALANGMTIDLLFNQVEQARKQSNTAIVWMGYYNCILQYGISSFIKKCAAVGIDGLIVPDLPLSEYESLFKEEMEKHGLCISFLVGPNTTEARIRQIDSYSKGFVYVVSDAATTGKSSSFSPSQIAYFSRLQAMQLKNPMVIGFGVHNAENFGNACHYASGAIVGSAFIKTLSEAEVLAPAIQNFVKRLRLF